jgi:hypothetical protein
MNKIALAVVVVLVVVTAAGAFYAGMKVGEDRVLQNPASFLQQFRPERGTPLAGQTPRPGLRGGQGFGGTWGTIEEVEGDALIVGTQEGTIRVQTTDTTLIEQYESVQVEDLEVGEQVIVSGSQNPDGSLTARSIRSLVGIQSLLSGEQ